MKTAEDLLEEMMQVAAVIRQELERLSGLAVNRVNFEHVYRTTLNEALLTAEGDTVPERKARAELDAAAQRVNYEQAAAEEMLCKERLHSARSVLSALQTAATSAREEARFARTGPDY